MKKHLIFLQISLLFFLVFTNVDFGLIGSHNSVYTAETTKSVTTSTSTVRVDNESSANPNKQDALIQDQDNKVSIIDKQEQIAIAKQITEKADIDFRSYIPEFLFFLSENKLYNIPIWHYIVAAVAIFAVFFIDIVFKYYLRHRNKKAIARNELNPRRLADYIWRALYKPYCLFSFAVLLRIIFVLLAVDFYPEASWFAGLLINLSFFFLLLQLVSLLDYYEKRYLSSHHDKRLFETVFPILGKLLAGVIFLLAVLHVYQYSTGKPLTTIVAGLGLGGLAIALASQETLKNLLGFASIAFDQPFLVNDRVSISGHDGVIEKIGLRSLKIRKYDGTAVVLPNSSAINSDIVNLTNRPYMRKNVKIYLHPNNTAERVERAIELVKEAMKSHIGQVPDKPPVVRFEDYEACRILISGYFWCHTNDTGVFADEVGRINLEIFKRLSEAKIQFAVR